METERSIVLQKKMILFLSFMIVAVFSLIYFGRNYSKVEEVFASEVETLDLITVVYKEDENEILRENVKFLAVDVIEKEEIQTETESGEQSLYEEAIVPNESNEIEIEEEIRAEEIEIVVEEVKHEVQENKVVKNEKKLVKYRDLAEDNPPEEYIKVVEASATAYCLCKKCCGKSPNHPYFGYTHSGIKIEQGSGIKVIAVDPNVIPLNSKVYVEGLNGAWDYGHAIAADTGSAIKELKIDLYMDTHEEALQWGRKKVKVYLLEE